MSDPWSEFTLVDEQPQRAPQPVFRAPDPGAEREIRREDASDAREDRTEQRAEDKERFARIGSLRTEFLGLEDVKAFRQVQNSTRQIQRLAERDSSAMGDLGLVFSYMKALDPGSVVREGEFATAQNATGVPGKIRNAYNQLVSGERLSDAQRKDMADAATAILGSRAEGYNEIARTYQGLLQAEGADPTANGVTLFELPEAKAPPTGGTPEVATMREAVNDGAEVRFGMDGWGGNDIFDRLEYLKETFGIGPTQEAQLSTSLNKMSGTDVTSAQIAALYGKLDIPLPEQAELDTMAESLRQGQRFSGFDTSDAEQQYLQGLREFNDQRDERVVGADGIADEERILQQGMTWGLSDEVQGVSQGLRAVGQGRNPVIGYQVGRDAERLALEEARGRQGAAGIAGEVAGGLMTGGVRTIPALTRAGMRAAPTAINEARAAGAIAGYGYGEGAVDSAVGAAVGAATGDLAARGFDRAARALANRAPNATQQAGREVIEAADRTNARTNSNIQPIPADVAGANVRRATSGTAQTTFGAAPVVNAAGRVNDEAAGAVETLASREGATNLSPQAAGEKAIQGADKTMKRMGTKVDALYANARRMIGDTRVPLTNSRAVAQRHLSELEDTPGGTEGEAYLRQLVDDIDRKPDWTPEGIRRMRKNLRDKFMKDGLRGSEIETRAMDIVDAAELDIEEGLVAVGKLDAAKIFQKARESAAERYRLIDDVIEPILGKRADRSGEGVFGAIERLSRGDATTLGKFMKALPADEAGAVRATVVSRLGRATPGQQDAAGDAFSLSRFLTNWNDEKLSKEAKAALFGGELRAALDDIARIAQGSKEAQRYANNSNTGGTNLFNAMINGAPFGVAALDLGTAAMAGAGSVLAQQISGRLLSSPAFARWLARAGKVTTEGQAQSHANSLSKIAASDTAISAEIIDFQQHLLRQLEGAPSRLAAEEDQGSGQGAASAEPREAGQ